MWNYLEAFTQKFSTLDLFIKFSVTSYVLEHNAVSQLFALEVYMCRQVLNYFLNNISVATLVRYSRRISHMHSHQGGLQSFL